MAVHAARCQRRAHSTQEEPGSDSPSSDGDDPIYEVAARSRTRRRLIRIAAAGLALLLVILLLLTSVPDASRLLQAPFTAAVPSPMLPDISTRIFFEHYVPWGTLRIDGQVATNPVLLPQNLPDGRPTWRWMTLPRGRHQLQYDAQLFAPLDCRISVPAASGDTCPVEYVNGGLLLDLGATLDRLPAEQVDALLAATQAFLTATTAGTIVEVGQHYRGADGSVVTASQPLYADVLAALSNNTSGASGAPNACVTLCGSQFPYSSADEHGWFLQAQVAVTMRYRRWEAGVPGSVILDHAPAASPLDDAAILAPLLVQWDGSWHVSVQEPLTCTVGAQMANPALNVPSYSWQSFVAKPPAAGCLFLGAQEFSTQGLPIGTAVYVLYRCGVLLAANETAQHLFPELPVAAPSEQALASQLAPTG